MKRMLLFTIFVMFSIVISGCASQSQTEPKEITCPKPYILIGNECCLDSDGDGICDKDKKEETKPVVECKDECDNPSCHGKEYLACLNQGDGCHDYVNKGKVLGQCGIECLGDEYCHYGYECLLNKCEKVSPRCVDECTDSFCKGNKYVACLRGSDGCLNEVNKGRVLGKCHIQCLDDRDCHYGYYCSSNYRCEREKPSCKDNCDSDTCSGHHYLKCEVDSSGCRNFNNKGAIIGKCGVECITYSDCNEGVNCMNNICTNEEPSEPLLG